MLRVLFVSVIVYLLMIVSTCLGQSPPPPPPPAKPVKVVGKAEVFYFKESDKTKVSVGFTLLGSAEKILKEDVFSVKAEFKVPGSKVTRPQTVDFILFSYTRGTEYRYKNDNQVTIFANDNVLISGVARPWFMNIDPRGGVTEYYDFSIPYEKLREVVKANKVSLKLGKTKFDFKSDHIEALKDINRTIE